MGKKLKNYQEFPKMKNNFVENIKDEKYFYSLIEDIENSKVGFYSVGLYPASLAYNCAMPVSYTHLTLPTIAEV